jgi:hypothetical protein
LAPLALILVAGPVGCYRATGETRPTTVAQQIPATGGDRVAGSKATAGPGDYYLGNDYIQMAVDGAPYGTVKGQSGAPSGGAILDIGGVTLDNAFKRVSLPTDNLESLAPVVNQDPDLRLVFDRYSTTNTADLVTLTMRGYLLDPLHKLAGATWTADGRVQGVTALHTISLGSHDIFFSLETSVSNDSGAALPIESLGDYLRQRGGGFRFVIPAYQDAAGNPLSSWGLDIPGSNFATPLTTSVRARMVGLEGAEPSADDLDSHQSLGIEPISQDQVLVASDPQVVLNQAKPVFPQRLVVGSVPVAGTLATGASLAYSRKVYGISGNSLTSLRPADARNVFNLMASDRAGRLGLQTGQVNFSTNGTAAYKGYRQTEIRFERFIADTTVYDPAVDSNPAHWSLTALISPEAGENQAFFAALPESGTVLPAVKDPAASGSYLPYRVIVRDKDTATTSQLLATQASDGAILPPAVFRPDPANTQTLAYPLSAESGTLGTPSGNFITPPILYQAFSVRLSGDTSSAAFVPARFTFSGLNGSGAPDPTRDPNVQRLRFLSGYFNAIVKGKVFLGQVPATYQFVQGNEAFGAQYLPGQSAVAFPLPLADYSLFVTSGPLSPMTAQAVSVGTNTAGGIQTVVQRRMTPPSGWISFDLPGPSQRTTGGMLAAEQLASALAEGVNVVGRTEDDAFTDGGSLYTSFHTEFTSSGDAATDAARVGVIGNDPMVVNARSSSLSEGTFTGLFSPAPDAATPFGGALYSEGWSVADFIGQGGGSFVIANRPRGPQGLFTAHPVAAGVPLGTGANAWWDDTDAKANGRRTGDLDAIELLRAEGCDPADPSAWFAEFKNVRADWFNLLNLQTPTSFTKGLGLSGGLFSLDTPVGLSRTYLKAGTGLSQADLSPVATALKSGAAVASTGPLLDVSVAGQGPGGFVTGTNATVSLTANLWFATWIPVDEIRVVVNGTVTQTLHLTDFTQDPADARHWSATITVPIATNTGNKDGWIVLEAGVPLATTGAYAVGTPWNKVMKGIYPVAVANPIFVDVDGGGYTAPL